MALDYTSYVNQMANLMVVGSTDSNFQTFLPGCIDYAEQRLYRELDLAATRVTDTSATLTPDVRTTTLSTTSGKFVVVEELNVLTPVGAVSSGTRNPVRFVSKQFIDALYPTAASSVAGVPQFASVLSDTNVLFGPTPASSYTIEVIGTIRPTPLSSSNTTTFLSNYLPDLLIAASMIFASKYMRDFSEGQGAGSNWSAEYDKLMMSAAVEEARKLYQSQGWTAEQPRPATTPERK